MATTLAAGGTSTATFSLGAFDSVYISAGSSCTGTLTVTSLANTLMNDFSVKVSNGTFGPYGVPVTVVISVTAGSMSYQVSWGIGGFSYDSSGDVTGLVGPSNQILALSETTAYVNLTATGTAFTGACEFAGYVCTVAAGNITIYDNTSAAGTVIVPTTALAVGAFPIFGSGTNGKMALTTGCHVVLSGAATVNVLVG